MSSKIEITPLTPSLGAQISGIDVGHLSDDDFESLYRHWLRYKVLFILEQQINLEQLQQFSRRFGELMRLPYIKPHDDHPDVIRVLKQVNDYDGYRRCLYRTTILGEAPLPA